MSQAQSPGKAPWERIFFVCKNAREGRAACAGSGAEEILHKLKSELKKNPELKQKVRVTYSGCLDQCDHGPVVAVFPEGTLYGHVKASDCDEIYREHVVGGRPVAKLLLGASQTVLPSEKDAAKRAATMTNVTSTPQRTPLYEAQKKRGGRMVEFAGWDMPVQFSGLIDEHTTVRTAVGMFDVSHMGEVRISGSDAMACVQMLVTQNIEKLTEGQAVYCVMCNEHGGIVDDLIVYRESDDSIFLVINAGGIAKDVAHIRKVASQFQHAVVDNLSDKFALLAVQGPKSDEVLARLLERAPEQRFTFVDTTTKAGIPVRVARTGYTGERGVEIFVAPAQAEALFEAIMVAGEPSGLKLCGLGARDSLRLEKKMALYGSDISDDTSPLEASLGWVVKFDKGDFVGRSVLEKQKAEGTKRQWVGFKMLDKAIPRHDYPVLVDGKEVGKVTSGTMSPTLKVGIGCAYLPTAQAKVGQKLQVVVRGEPHDAEVVKTPFL